MEDKLKFELFMEEIASIQKNIRDKGATKAGKGNYNPIYSLDQLNELFNKNTNVLSMTFMSASNAEVIVTEGKMNVTSQSQYVFRYNKEEKSKAENEPDIKCTFTLSIPVTGIGTDRNDASFALGKSLTYSRRYFLLGLLGLGSADLEPENPEVMIKELKTSIKAKLAADDNNAAEFKAAYKTKYKVDFDINKLTVAMLQNIDNAL